MLILLGIWLIVCYKRVPLLKAYWSKDESFGNATIKKEIAHDRFPILASKLYFTGPGKTDLPLKTLYRRFDKLFDKFFPASSREFDIPVNWWDHGEVQRPLMPQWNSVSNNGIAAILLQDIAMIWMFMPAKNRTDRRHTLRTYYNKIMFDDLETGSRPYF